MTKNRSKIVLQALPTAFGNPNSFASVLEAAPAALGLWGAPATLLDGFWPLWARLGRPKIGFGPAFGRSKTLPGASGRVPEAPEGAQNGPKSIFRRFGVDSGWIFLDF